MLVSNLDSAFVVWNKLTTTTTSKLQLPNQPEESSGESDSQCFMVQGNDSLEVQSETHLDSDDCSSSSCDENIDPHALNEELSIVCEKLIEKYKVLKKKTFALTKENEKIVF